MARYPSRAKGSRGSRTRSLIYVVSGLAVVVVVVAFMYGPSSSDAENEAPLLNSDVNDLARPMDEPIDLPIVEPSPVREPEPGPASAAAAEPDPETILNPLPEGQTGVIATPDANIGAPGPLSEDGSNSPQVAALIVEAMDLLSARPAKVIEARDMLNNALRMPMSAQQRILIRKELSKLADKWLFSRSVFPEDDLCTSYKVKSGDHLATIGRKHKVPYQLVMEINGIRRPQDLRAGATLKLVNGPFHARITKSTFTLDIYLQNTFVRSYPVGLGMPGRDTPTGGWVVKNRMVKPTWTDPDTGRRYEASDKDYPLGSRWIGLEGKTGEALGRTGFAIHGTNKPEQIGTRSSRGCIRLHNGNVIEVYNMLVKGASQVIIAE